MCFHLSRLSFFIKTGKYPARGDEVRDTECRRRQEEPKNIRISFMLNEMVTEHGVFACVCVSVLTKDATQLHSIQESLQEQRIQMNVWISGVSVV